MVAFWARNNKKPNSHVRVWMHPLALAHLIMYLCPLDPRKISGDLELESGLGVEGTNEYIRNEIQKPAETEWQ
ncbi:unnamed protein product [Dovyalis caffra]|uniref:Uncharacterized protein n=1 Tax=Dovyalis caffra TaxID=77055 RepID=A0AAV1S538_9ROSI|nr:unnamed protein product [Dovyalis caffra]